MSQHRLASIPASDQLPKGIQRIRALPDPELEALWTSIVTEPQFKDRLVGQAVLNFTLRRRVKRSVVPLHGVILLTGEPGTGKTSLARGLASRISSILGGAKGHGCARNHLRAAKCLSDLVRPGEGQKIRGSTRNLRPQKSV